MSKEMLRASIEIWKLQPHPKNVRRDIGDITELTDSIRAQGIMQNLLVVPVPGHEEDLDLFWVVIGNRRLAAAEAADKPLLPCTIALGLTEQEQIELMLVENLQRRDLTPIEEAQAYEQLTLDFGLSAEQISEKTGVSASTIRKRLKIAELDQDEVKNKSFQLSLGDYAALEKIKDVSRRNAVLGAAFSSENLRYLADREAQEEEQRRKVNEMTAKIIEKYGVVLADERDNSFYIVGSFFSFDDADEAFRKIDSSKIGACDTIWVTTNGPTAYVYGHPAKEEEAKAVSRKNDREEKARERIERQEQKRDRDHRFVLKACRAAADDRREFIAGVVKGRYKLAAGVTEQDAQRRLWAIIRRIGAVETDTTTLAAYVAHVEKYGMDEALKTPIIESPAWVQMLATAGEATNKSDYLCRYGGNYDNEKGETLAILMRFLESMGYSIRDQEQTAVLAGTHDCWEREA